MAVVGGGGSSRVVGVCEAEGGVVVGWARPVWEEIRSAVREMNSLSSATRDWSSGFSGSSFRAASTDSNWPGG